MTAPIDPDDAALDLAIPTPADGRASGVVPIEAGHAIRALREESEQLQAKIQELHATLRHVDGKVERSLTNIASILERDPRWVGVLSWDTFSERTEAIAPPPFDREPGPWREIDLSRTVIWLTSHWDLDVRKGLVRDAIEVVADKHKTHAVARYLDALSWDGVDRLPGVLSTHFGVDASEWSLSIGSKWLIGAVARAYDPGCQLDTMLVLEGEGGLFKSSGLRALAGPEWFTDHTAEIGSRDAALQMIGRWFVEYPEMDGLRDQRIDRVKEIITRREERHVHKWEKDARTSKRSCVLVGTCQHNDYLHGGDSGEARRFWPVEVVRPVDVDAIRRDRDQLWAEAVHRYYQSEPWWLTGAEDAFGREQAAGRADDALVAVVRAAIQGHEDDGVIPAQIMMHVYGKNRSWGPKEQKQIAKCLRMLGWTRQRPRTSGGREYRYRPKPEPISS